MVHSGALRAHIDSLTAAGGAAARLVALVDLDLTILDASDAFLKSTFTWRNEIQGCRVFDVFPDNPDLADADGVRNLRASFDSVLRAGLPHQLATQRYDVRDRDGAWVERHWAQSVAPVFSAAGGHVVQIVLELRDITEAVQLHAWIGEQLCIADEQCKTLERMRQETLQRTQRLQDADVQARAILGSQGPDRGQLKLLTDELGAPNTQTHWQPGALATVSGVYSVLHGPSCTRANGQTAMRAGWVFSTCSRCGDALAYRLIRRLRGD